MEELRFMYLVMGIVGFIGCIVLLIGTIKSHIQVNRNILKSWEKYFLYLNNISIFKTDDFFCMVNNGEDLCSASEEIQYIDYIEKRDLFMVIGGE